MSKSPTDKYTEWVAAHKGQTYLLTTERAYLAGYSDASFEPGTLAALKARLSDLRDRMSRLLNSPDRDTLAGQLRLAELDRDIQDYLA